MRASRCLARLGLIPAHAGKTGRAEGHHGGRRAHPRSRGENASLGRGTALAAGSSPLTRGKRVLGEGDSLSDGLIPAHAGKTTSAPPRYCMAWAHPRSRGENVSMAPLGDQGWWLIPAHAGKTGNKTATAKQPQAHPRSRGENSLMPRMTLSPAGSSPLTRGKHGYAARRRRSDRLIPAHAGKTSSLRR